MSILMPKKVKHRKWHKAASKGIENRATEINFGSFGLKSLDTKWLTARQIEAARRHIIRYFKKGGKLWTRIFPDKPITARPAGKRMGGGKGDISTYVAVVRPGMILFEVAGADPAIVKEAFRKASAKLPIDIKIISREQE